METFLGTRNSARMPAVIDPETGCSQNDPIAFQECRQAFFIKQQNKILKLQMPTPQPQQQEPDIKIQLEGMQKKIDTLESQQVTSTSKELPIVSSTRVPTTYWIVVIAMGLVIAIGVWKIYLKK